MLYNQSQRFFLLASVFLLSACALAYEILLMRLFAIIQWHHFAYMIIGLALLGYGFSGTLVSLLQHSLKNRFGVFYISSVILFAFSSVGMFMLAQQIPFNAEVILWDRQQLFFLAVLFLLLSIPFFFAATAICLSFIEFKDKLAQVYAADLTGAAAGSLIIIFLMFTFFPQHVLLIVGLLAIVAAIGGRTNRFAVYHNFRFSGLGSH